MADFLIPWFNTDTKWGSIPKTATREAFVRLSLICKTIVLSGNIAVNDREISFNEFILYLKPTASKFT